MSRGTQCVKRIARLPIPHADKAHQIRTKATPAAIYGGEVSQIGEKQQQAYATAIKDTISNHTTHKGSNTTFVTSSYGSDLDPETGIFTNRILLLRRSTAKRDDLDRLARQNLRDYIKRNYIGTNRQQVMEGTTTPAPPPGTKNRALWKPKRSPFGPIGLLLCSVHAKAAALADDFQLHNHGWPTKALLSCPYHELRPIAARLTINARALAKTSTRKSNSELYEIDRILTTRIYKQLDKGDAGLLRLVQQGAAWDKCIMHHMGNTSDRGCPFCQFT